MSLQNDILQLFPDAKQQTGYVRVRCPYHKGGMERKPSMSILTEKKDSMPPGYARCFTCGWVGTFANIAEDFGLSYIPDGTDVTSSDSKTREVTLHLQQATYKKDVPFLFSPYLASRGITKETQKLYRCYHREDEHKVYMPVFSREGKYLYSNARSTQGKAFFVEGGKHKALAGLEEVDFAKPIVITEGQIDMMTFVEAQFCRATATLGAQNVGSVEALKEAIGPFLLAFDTDSEASKFAGQQATKKAIDILGAYRCKIIKFAQGEDANSLWIACNFNREKFIGEIEKRIIPVS